MLLLARYAGCLRIANRSAKTWPLGWLGPYGSPVLGSSRLQVRTQHLRGHHDQGGGRTRHRRASDLLLWIERGDGSAGKGYALGRSRRLATLHARPRVRWPRLEIRPPGRRGHGHEDDHHQNNLVLTAVVHPSVEHVVVDIPLRHLSLSRFLSEVIDQPPLRDAADAPSLGDAFGLHTAG